MTLSYSIDGNKVCAVGANFQCLATCNAGFGDSLKEAFLDYYKTTDKPALIDCKSWEIDWVNEIEPREDLLPTKDAVISMNKLSIITNKR